MTDVLGHTDMTRRKSRREIERDLDDLADDAQDGDRFGFSVSVDGDTALVGAYFGDPDGKSDAGSAYVFLYVENRALQTQPCTIRALYSARPKQPIQIPVGIAC